MGSSDKHWTELLRESIAAELNELAAEAKNIFSDIRPRPRKLSRRERVAQFLSMTREQRQQLYAEMGPEEYGAFVQRNLDDLVSLIGPAANALLPYFYADGMPLEAVSESAADIEQQLTSMLPEDVLAPLAEDEEGK